MAATATAAADNANDGNNGMIMAGGGTGATLGVDFNDAPDLMNFDDMDLIEPNKSISESIESLVQGLLDWNSMTMGAEKGWTQQTED